MYLAVTNVDDHSTNGNSDKAKSVRNISINKDDDVDCSDEVLVQEFGGEDAEEQERKQKHLNQYSLSTVENTAEFGNPSLLAYPLISDQHGSFLITATAPRPPLNTV